MKPMVEVLLLHWKKAWELGEHHTQEDVKSLAFLPPPMHSFRRLPKKHVIHETNNYTCCELGKGRPWPRPDPKHKNNLRAALQVVGAFPTT
jgi:hypothetical protein